MANENKDIIRVEDTEANLPTTLISGQLGFTTDTNKLGHLMLDGVTMQWFTSTDDSWIYWSGAGWGGVTTDSPDGKFHIWTGSAGSVSADTNMNELVLENDGDCGMTILAPDIYDCTVCFGSPSDNQGAIVNWNHDDDEFKIDTIGEFKLYTNDGTVALYVHDTQDALLATSLGINIGMTTAATEVLEVGGNAKIKGHIYQTDDYNDKHVWGVFNQCSITHDNTDMVLNSQEAGSGNFAFNGGNIRIDDDHYIGLDSDTDLLQLSSGTLKVNGNIIVDDNGYIGLDSDTNLLQLAADTLRVYGSVKIADDTYVGNVINPNLIKLTSGSVVEVNGNIQIDNNAYIGLDADTDSGYIGCDSDSDLLQLTSSNLEVLGDCSHNADSQKNYFGAGDDCSITYDGTNMIFDSQEVGSGNFTFNGGNIQIDDDHYIGLDSDTDLLQLSSSILKLNGSLQINDDAYIGIDSDTDLMRLYSGRLYLDGILQLTDVIYAPDGTAPYRFANSASGMFHAGSDELGFQIGATEKVRIDGSGNVGIQTTAPSTALDVNGNGRFRSIGSTASAGALHYTADGTLTTNTSDERLKENIKPIKNALDKICNLDGISFDWKDEKNTKRNIGMLAQKVEKVIPELVFTNVVDGYKGIHYDKMVAVLIEAIKELNYKIS